MSAKEVTEFLCEYFNPRYALNMDGGGSTTMYIKGSGESLTDVVNYPTDNNRYDHYGQRRVSTHFLIKKKQGNTDSSSYTTSNEKWLPDVLVGQPLLLSDK